MAIPDFNSSEFEGIIITQETNMAKITVQGTDINIMSVVTTQVFFFNKKKILLLI